MIIKSYIENTATAALKKIREEMGQQALILHTRHIRGGQYGRRIEITACIDEALVPSLRALIGPETGDGKALISMEKKTVDISRTPSGSGFISDSGAKETMPSELGRVYDRLLDFDVPAGAADEFLKDIRNAVAVDRVSDSTVRAGLVTSVAKLFNCQVNVPVGCKVMFIGASGAGKTSTMAKMAAELTAFRRTKVRLTSFDTQKISAFEEVGGYADLLEAPYEINPKSELKAAKNEVLLIDTASMPYTDEGVAAVQSLINLTRPNLVFMVLSVCNRAGDIIDFKEGIRKIQPDLLIATHLDETRRWGSMLAAAMATGIPLAFVTDSPGGVGQLHVPDPDQVVAKIMNEKEAHHE